ncbi:hypothetical protein AK812_SmicGene41668 [Symbiodinium microadriaticum]|uniref:Uncharacterized protein n=1 Tax=Symbiodinium microadriaticum TaxID=2951 RepID=A0A1Q9C5I2_SYMMI|nr:hypothetical protein AK812_SmicGene41668 [Symbiodinium microadriaticum]
MAKVVLLSKLDSKGKKGAWLRLQEDEPARTREELLYHFGCSVLDGTHVETGSRFYKHEEVWFVVERLLVQDGLDKGAKALQVWDVQMQKHVSFAFKYEEDDPSYEEYELEEEEALALNCLEELDPEEAAESGHAIQLQLAANAAFGKAKAQKAKRRGKGKGKGKVVRSHLTLDERRDKMKALKAKSKCLSCGTIGHWARDPGRKFPNQKGGKRQGKNRANIAIVAPRQNPDGGLYEGQKKVPLNPPKDRCADCTDCSYAGNGPQGKFEDHAVSEKLLEATEQAVPIIQALTADDATADLNPEAVEQLMVLLQDRVSQAIALEECIHPAALHEWLRQAITTVMDQSPSSPSWGFVPTALVARGRSPGKRKGKGKGKGKAKAKGKPPAPEQQPGGTTAEPEFYQISDPLGADTFVGSQCPELDADYREAILLESFRTKSELHDPFPASPLTMVPLEVTM